jgi:hypothetical protein
MPELAEILGGILRFFPNTMFVTFLIAGIMTGRMPWILAAAGGLVTIATTSLFQGLAQWFLGIDAVRYDFKPGEVAADSCSLTPSTDVFIQVPSMWIATSAFYATYIFTNALNIYTYTSTTNQNRIPVQQRKGMGLISMVAVFLLFFFLLVPRFMTTCESIMGTITGLGIGIGWGVAWWHIVNLCGANIFPDVHGVMIGLTPGSLKSNPFAYVPL